MTLSSLLHVTSRCAPRAVGLLTTCALLAVFGGTARAATFTVTNTTNSGAGSLRDAIDSANSAAGADTIAFNIPTNDANYSAVTGVATIRPTTDLPTITGANTTIDGTTQTTNRGNTNTLGPEISIATATTGALSYGFITNSTGDGTIIKGLIISGFGYGIFFNGSDNDRVEGCYIGTNRTGGAAGAVLNSYGVYIGGGIGNVIGGSGVAANRIGFGQSYGIFVTSATDSAITGNTILSNSNSGIYLSSGTNNDVTSNVISSNASDGITVASGGTGNTLSQNSIFGNGGTSTSTGNLGIDIDADGVTPNDALDADTGTNNRQNFPIITSVTETGGNTVVSGTLPSLAFSIFNIELFRNTPAVGPDITGFGEGEVFVAAASATSNASGSAPFSFTVPGTFAAGTTFSATATSSASGDTSEFAPSIALGNTPGVVTSTLNSGSGSLRSAISFANGVPGTTISFNIPSSDAGYSASTGVSTITVTTDLPTLNVAGTTIDGTTQTSNRGNTNTQGPEVAIVTATTGAISYGLFLNGNADNSVIKSLIISGFGSFGLYFADCDNSRVESCYLGTDRTGLAAGAVRNSYGVFVSGGSGNLIGGSDVATANRIGFSQNQGVYLSSGTNNDVTGNVIFSNDTGGIYVASGGTGHTLSQNSIFSNGGTSTSNLGIDIDGGGVTANDALDADTGSNNRQNFPVITSVTQSGGNTVVNGTLSSTPNSDFLFEVFRNTPGVGTNASGYGEGEIYLGSTGTLTDGSGVGTWTLTVPGTFAAGTTFSATTTNENGDTSEFGPSRSLLGDASVVINTLNAGSGSLRSAINFANTTPGTTISFNIANSDTGYSAATGVSTITVTTDLPTLNAPGTTIDGTTQTSNRGNTNTQGPEVAIVTATTGAANYGFILNSNADGVVVKNLIISGFGSFGIYLAGCDNSRIEGCYFGTDATGFAAAGVLNNYGVYVGGGTGNIIGGVSAGAANRIGFNQNYGVFLSNSANGRVTGNVIFSNGADGIALSSGSGNTFSQNSIFGNGGTSTSTSNLGIDIDDDGITPNDASDADTGTNNRQNFPVLTAAAVSGSTVTITGTLNSIPNRSFVVEYFRSDAKDPSGNGEGQTYLGSQTVTTNGSGVASVNVSLPISGAGGFVSSTATYAASNAAATGAEIGDTSEFGPSVPALPPAATSGALISEFRLSGPNSTDDEFIEIYNASNSVLNISGWSVVAGAVKVDIPGNTPSIPVRGHLLLTGGNYSLSSYGGSNAALGDVPYTVDIPLGSSLELRNAANTVVDAVTTTSLPSPLASSDNYSYVRRLDSAFPQDTGNDVNDFNLVDVQSTVGPNNTTGVTSGVRRIGAPGPENLNSPTVSNALISFVPASPSVVRTGTGNSGTLSLRNVITNRSGRTITALRFRVVGLTSGTTAVPDSAPADIRLTSASANGTLLPFVLETPPSQPNGGGLNSSMSLSGLPSGGLAPGASITVEMLFNIFQKGTYRFLLNLEPVLRVSP